MEGCEEVPNRDEWRDEDQAPAIPSRTHGLGLRIHAGPSPLVNKKRKKNGYM
jgi:hypothetical protein